MFEIHPTTLILGLVLGGLIGYFLGRQRMRIYMEQNQKSDPRLPIYENKVKESDHKISELQGELFNLNNELVTIKEKFLSSQKEIALRQSHFEEKELELKKNFEESKKSLTDEFKVMADKIFEDKSDKYSKRSKIELESFLIPLKEKIKTFEEKVEKTYKDGNEERITLKNEIKELAKLNQKLSQDANNLVTALKGENKTQGDWGEMQLETILEKAGLLKDIHFSTQSSFRDEVGQLKRPDLIIHLPENKNLIIDSKVSLVNYEAYVSADDPNEKQIFLKKHLNSLKGHIKDLNSKKYQELYQIQTPDYVLMFVPIEPALSLAIQSDQNMFLDALEKNVVLVTNSTLLATMKTVSFIWKQEDQKKNVIEIARQGAAMYDKFVGFTEDLLKIGRQLNLAKDQYDSAMGKLSTGRDNLVRKSEKLRDLGLKTQKQLHEKLLERSDDN